MYIPLTVGGRGSGDLGLLLLPLPPVYELGKSVSSSGTIVGVHCVVPQGVTVLRFHQKCFHTLGQGLPDVLAFCSHSALFYLLKKFRMF